MSVLNSRDAQGYPLKGYDFVPKPKEPFNELIMLLQQADEREDALKRDVEHRHRAELVKLLQQANEREDALKRLVEHWHRAYNALLQEHMAFKYEDLCSACKRHQDKTKAGDTIPLCEECSTVKKAKRSLELKLEKAHQEVRYWRDCYETLLQQYTEDDRRGHDGTHKKV